ncbi:MAG TPA: hypothetical protein DEB46_02515 [Myxococcales bacterium]|nr:hypothetical protein [Myxococcales bacterium]
MSRFVLLGILSAGLVACDSDAPCAGNKDCEGGKVCMVGRCQQPCNTDCECPEAFTCGPTGFCVSGGQKDCRDGQAPTCDGADLTSDPLNCGLCGRQCAFGGGVGRCVVGQCELDRCLPGFYNLDGESGNGCEYLCQIDLNAPQEVCDNRDNDCDGEVDEGMLRPWYRDSDSDGTGVAGQVVLACMRPDGYADNDRDCDDQAPARNLDAIEVCDGLDNDCDDAIDEDLTRTFWPDGDGDGIGSGTGISACFGPPGYVDQGNDCDDNDSNNFPGNTEICDNRDNDCDFVADNGATTAYYLDGDGDGHGRAISRREGCSPLAGEVERAGDCDDEDAEVHENHVEICDGKDNNCVNGTDDEPLITFYRDQDGDQFGRVEVTIQACERPAGYAYEANDCDDADASKNPAASERCDAVDNNCNELIDENLELVEQFVDADGDGFGDGLLAQDSACVGHPQFAQVAGDCDDSSPSRYPGAPEYCDQLDQDCDLVPDNDIVISASDPQVLTQLEGPLQSIEDSFQWLSWIQLPAGEQDVRTFSLSLPVPLPEDPSDPVIEDQSLDNQTIHLPDLGDGTRYVSDRSGDCLFRRPGQDWSSLPGSGNCRVLAYCGEDRGDWVILVADSTGAGDEQAITLRLSPDDQVEVHQIMATGASVLNGRCSRSDRALIGILENGKERVLMTGAGTQTVALYDNPVLDLSIIDINEVGDSLIAILLADGSIDSLGVDAQEAMAVVQRILAPPSAAGGIDLVPTPSGGILIYSRLEPAFEQGIWALPLSMFGTPAGRSYRIHDIIPSGPLTAAGKATPGQGVSYYGSAGSLQGVAFSCTAP